MLSPDRVNQGQDAAERAMGGMGWATGREDPSLHPKARQGWAIGQEGQSLSLDGVRHK